MKAKPKKPRSPYARSAWALGHHIVKSKRAYTRKKNNAVMAKLVDAQR